jgi:Ca2+-binding EF-hand superfamily protein
MKKILAVAVVIGMFLPILGTAQEKKGKKTAEEQFAALDANNDKKLSKEEYVARLEGEKKSKGEQRFGRWDKNSDGTLSLEEYKEGVAMQKKKN